MLVSLRETVAPVGCKWTVIQVGETAVLVLVYLPSSSTMVTVVDDDGRHYNYTTTLGSFELNTSSTSLTISLINPVMHLLMQ